MTARKKARKLTVVQETLDQTFHESLIPFELTAQRVNEDKRGKNHWMIVNAEHVPGRRFVRVLYEKPSGEEVQFEFEVPLQPDAKGEGWIELELVRQLRERAVSC